MDAVIEPFVDPEVRIFLNRFADGAFDGFAGIVFVRDDAPALTAYQYALEWVRQGSVRGATPPLFLLNTIHAATAPVRTFNRMQIEKLMDFLAGIGLPRIGDGELAQQARHAGRRHKALAATLGSAEDAMMFRIAGRFLPMQRHAQLLEEAMDQTGPTDAGSGVRLGIVGSPLFSERAYTTFGKYGPIVCDLQPFGQIWPGDWEEAETVETMLELLAGDAFCHRISPPNRYRERVVEALVAARCELVLCQLAQTDDTFGWDIPELSRQLEDRGIRFVNLGFRDAQPDDAWLARATRAATEYQRDWLKGLRAEITSGAQYAFVNADTPHELFHAMGVPIVTNQWWSAVIAAKQLSEFYFDHMQAIGYHERLARYSSLPLIAELEGDAERQPWGGLPVPSMLCARQSADDHQKIFALWAEKTGAPLTLLSAPAVPDPLPDWWNRARTDWEALYHGDR
ncbi:unnamed protein product, partial [Symbiodinium necroappetens]